MANIPKINIPSYQKPGKYYGDSKIWSPQGLRDNQFQNNPVQKNIRNGTPMKNYDIPGFKKGGKVNKTGLAMVHKGERVLTAKQEKKLNNKVIKNLKKNGKNKKR